MIKCSKEAYNRCPDRHLCGSLEDAVFLPGSECEKFNQENAKGGKRVNKVSYEERAKIYTEALDTYGACAQLVVALEELSEAQKEICKAMRGKANILRMAEEVADATIMLEQVRQIFGINEEVCKAMDLKMARLRQRVDDEKAHRAALDKERRDLIRKVFIRAEGIK